MSSQDIENLTTLVEALLKVTPLPNLSTEDSVLLRVNREDWNQIQNIIENNSP